VRGAEQQSLTLPVAGLFTDPGPFTAAPEGALAEAHNVIVLRPGVIEPRPGFQWQVDSAINAAGGMHVRTMYTDPNDVVFVWATDFGSWLMRRFGTATITGPGEFSIGKVRVCPTGGRALFTANSGVCTLPLQLASPQYGSATLAYRSGLPQAHVTTSTLAAALPAGYPAAGAWLANNNYVAYRFTIRRRLANGTVLESAPSNRMIVANTSGGARCVQMFNALGNPVIYAEPLPGGFASATYDNPIEGDELCIYRGPAGTSAEPSDEMRFVCALPYDPVTSGFFDESGTAAFIDTLPEAQLTGPALYTNETQEGAFLANYRAEYARDITLYNGMTFYAGARTAQRVDLVLNRLATATTVVDPQKEFYSYQFTGDTLIGTNTILNATNIRNAAIGMAISSAAPTAAGTFPVDTFITAVDRTTNTITLSQSALVTALGGSLTAWDWIDVDGTKMYYAPSAGFAGTLPANYFRESAQSLEGRVNDSFVWFPLQTYVTGTTQTSQLAITITRSDCDGASFDVTASKPNAWDKKISYNVPVASAQLGSPATLQWSKLGEPEHCPLPYRTVVGDAAHPIRRILVARSSLLIFKDDGLYQCFGQLPEELTFEPLDRTIVLPISDGDRDAPSDWVARYNDQVFAMTARGPMSITDAGGTLVGAPILETLRYWLGDLFGGGNSDGRGIVTDYAGRRVVFMYAGANGIAFVLDVDTGLWTTWSLGQSAGGYSPSAASVRTSNASSGNIYYTLYNVAGGNRVGWPANRVSLIGANGTSLSFPIYSWSDTWLSQTCTVLTVTGTGPYTVTIAAGSQWTPTVGDTINDGNDAHPVSAVASATEFTTLSPPLVGSCTWYQGYPIAVRWVANDGGSPAMEKHFLSYSIPMEQTMLMGGAQMTFTGYRNATTHTQSFYADPGAGLPPWSIAPSFVRLGVPTALARDWGLLAGFTVRQAGAWFQTAGTSMLYTVSAPDKVARTP
jgi:hypothetical protein